MSRAEERALEAYPKSEKYTTSQRLIINDLRDGFIQGYEAAEKDLALTWGDIESIVKIADSLLTGTAWDAVDWPDEQKYYEEVLKRYLEAKK